MGTKTSKPCPKKTARDQLADFCKSTTKSFMSVTVDLSSAEWRQHEHAQSNVNNCDLNGQEHFEISLFLRTLFAQKNAKLFWQLTSLCQAVFREITISDLQRILGLRANLEFWDPLARSAYRIEYKPPKLYPKTCQSLENCIESLKVPRSFGSRTLWQLAARTAPESFGYSPNSLNSLFDQPYWTTILPSPPLRMTTFDDVRRQYECNLNVRSLQLIVDAAYNCFKDTTIPSLTINPHGGKIQPYYGMNNDGSFQWGHIRAEFPDQPQRLFSAAYEQYRTGDLLLFASVSKFLSDQEVPPDSTFTSAASRVNEVLESYEIPLHLKCRTKAMCFKLQYKGTTQNPLFA